MAYDISWWERRVLAVRGPRTQAAQQPSPSVSSVSSSSLSPAAPSMGVSSVSRAVGMAGEDVMVDALEEGAIVRVPESYARREELPILRKFAGQQQTSAASSKPGGPKETGGIDTFRRLLRHEAQGIKASLVDNFHWELQRCRRKRRLTRKQVAEALHVKEQDIKLIENGILPANDFVLVSALERYFNVTLRKEGAVASPPPARELRVMREQPRWMRLYEDRATTSRADKVPAARGPYARREGESKIGKETVHTQRVEKSTPTTREDTATTKRSAGQTQSESESELTGSGIELADDS